MLCDILPLDVKEGAVFWHTLLIGHPTSAAAFKQVGEIGGSYRAFGAIGRVPIRVAADQRNIIGQARMGWGMERSE